MIDFTPIFRRLGLLDEPPEGSDLDKRYKKVKFVSHQRGELPPDSADVVIARINGAPSPNGSVLKEPGVNNKKFLVVAAYLQQGLSNGAISEATGIHYDTVAKHRAKWEAENGGNLRCLCGREAGHNGWCAARLARSVRRQEFLRQRWGVLKQSQSTAV